MDALITASARALACGDALGALKHVALRDDPPALALRGIAMAQLGEWVRARRLLRRAARGFGPQEVLARARCALAEAEVALALRELGGAPRTLLAMAALLQAHADPGNATHAQLIAARRLLLLGRLTEAAATLAGIDTHQPAPPALVARASLVAAELALRTLHTAMAQQALAQAQAAAARAAVPALMAEVAEVQALLDRPAARRWRPPPAEPTDLRLADVEALLGSGLLVVDACRHGLRSGSAWCALARRPVLFALAQALAEAWPADVERDSLIARVFRLRQPDETHRARLRVEIGRLRMLAAPLAGIEATARGYRLAPPGQAAVALLLPPIAGDTGALQALLADGAAWSTSALALALRDSQRTVQRSLAALQAAGAVRSIGGGRSQRWLAAPLAPFTTILLLPTALRLA